MIQSPAADPRAHHGKQRKTDGFALLAELLRKRIQKYG